MLWCFESRASSLSPLFRHPGQVLLTSTGMEDLVVKLLLLCLILVSGCSVISVKPDGIRLGKLGENDYKVDALDVHEESTLGLAITWSFPVHSWCGLVTFGLYDN